MSGHEERFGQKNLRRLADSGSNNYATLFQFQSRRPIIESMDTISRSWALAKESYAVLRRVPSLVVFPILSSIATILVMISFALPAYMLTGGKNLKQVRPEIGYPVMFLFYFLTYFVV